MPEQNLQNHRHPLTWQGLSRVTAIALTVASFEASPALGHSLPAHHNRTKTQHIAPAGDVAVTETDPTSGEYLSPLPNQTFVRPSAVEAAGNNQVITINDKITYQRFEGIGAAMTDSSAWLIQDGLTPAGRTRLMTDLFSKSGIRLNFVRIPMGASDFTRNGVPYSYDDMPPGQTDPALSHFSIAHDRAYILPALHEAEAENPHIIFSMNPWSPPGWMKSNDSLDNSDGAGVFLPQYDQQFANYEVKSVAAYDRAGVPISDLVPTNEPNVGTLYPGMNFSAQAEGTYISQYLDPALNAAGLNSVKVYGNDLSWDATGYANTVLQMVPHLGGLAWHCYTGDPATMKLYPNVNEIMDECSNELPHFPAALIMAEAFRDNVSIASVWNIALQPGGGPVQPPDKGCPGCFGVVTINPETHTYRYTRRYYQLGQLSHFIMRGAVRVDSQASDEPTFNDTTQAFSPGLVDVAFKNPDGTKELVVYNNNSSTTTFNVNWNGRVLPNYKVAPGATTTFSWKK
jgi:glucosylceramidase